MRRSELAERIHAVLPAETVVICGLGSTSRTWRAIDPTHPTYYASDPMGMAPSLALGFALVAPDRSVLLLEGDGDLLMGLSSLVTIAAAAPPNLRMVVFHNRMYETGGRQPLPEVEGLELSGVAGSAGLPVVLEAVSVDEVDPALGRLLESPGPGLLVAEIEQEDSPYGPPGQSSKVEERMRFRRALREEGRS